jgi:transcriptional regulator with XRE-family HTH domain
MRELRKNLKVHQKDVGALMHASTSYVSHLETRKETRWGNGWMHRTKLSYLTALAKLSGTDLAQLLGMLGIAKVPGKDQCTGCGQPITVHEVYGKQMRELRISKGINLMEMSRRMGKCPAYVSKLELGTKPWKLPIKQVYLEALGQ